MDYKKLFHKEEAFQRETFQKRMEEFGFKNMARMELFLWDLELFLHIQKILGDKIILKGGAATQFYLPRDAQRTSVDIDMLFFGTEEEIKKTLRKIEEYLGTEDELFYFHKHSPIRKQIFHYIHITRKFLLYYPMQNVIWRERVFPIRN